MSDARSKETCESRGGLHGLPEFAPDPALWTRIVAARSRALARHRRLRVFGGAVAAGLVALVLAWPLQRPEILYSAAPDVESRALESELREVSGLDSRASGRLHRLRFIDASLQSAYDRGAHPDELARLWRQRNEALRGLISQFRNAGDRSAEAITRI